MLNWIVLNRTDYLHKNWFGVKITYKRWYAIKPNKPNQTKPNQNNTIGKGIESPYPPHYRLNSISAVRQGYVWHLITHESWYVIKKLFYYAYKGIKSRWKHEILLYHRIEATINLFTT